MTSINPINVNTQGIGNALGYGTAKAKTEDKETKETGLEAGAQQKAVSADEVLNFMAQSSASVTPSTTSVDPSKYVDKASAERIAGFMSQFEDIVANNLSAITAEFPEMSEGGKQALALAQVNKQM